MQTAVNWLVDELRKYDIGNVSLMEWKVLNELSEQAKEMERKQHSKTWDKALDAFEARGHNYVRAWEDFDEWYETYGSKGSDETKTN